MQIVFFRFPISFLLLLLLKRLSIFFIDTHMRMRLHMHKTVYRIDFVREIVNERSGKAASTYLKYTTRRG
jgi:hypothetical protein